jgi:hypothetical protein
LLEDGQDARLSLVLDHPILCCSATWSDWYFSLCEEYPYFWHGFVGALESQNQTGEASQLFLCTFLTTFLGSERLRSVCEAKLEGGDCHCADGQITFYTHILSGIGERIQIICKTFTCDCGGACSYGFHCCSTNATHFRVAKCSFDNCFKPLTDGR